MDRFSPIEKESNNKSQSEDNEEEEDEQMTPHIGDEIHPNANPH